MFMFVFHSILQGKFVRRRFVPRHLSGWVSRGSECIPVTSSALSRNHRGDSSGMLAEQAVHFRG
jgi:hypothetical protein